MNEIGLLVEQDSNEVLTARLVSTVLPLLYLWPLYKEGRNNSKRFPHFISPLCVCPLPSVVKSTLITEKTIS